MAATACVACGVCKRPVRVRKDGTLAKHASHGATTCPNSRSEVR